jgi:zinc transporter ZupT
MSDTTLAERPPAQAERRLSLGTLALLLLPLLALGLVIFAFLQTGGGVTVEPPAPIEALSFERTVLRPGQIELHVRNTGPEALTLAQVIINDAIWPMRVEPSTTMPRLSRATVLLDYPWVLGEAYAIKFLTGNAIAFTTDIPVAAATPEPEPRTFWGFTLIGLYVGVIPVYLGLVWFPALRQVGRRWMNFLLAITIGLLIYLGIEALAEALELASVVPGPFQGVGLVGLGAVVTFLLLDAIGRQQTATGRGDAERRLRLSFLIALGIGLHNLGEGLAIGAAYTVGEFALGAFLVVGFILQNITEGLGIIAPILRDRPTLRSLVLLGLLGGFPAVVGAWIGAFTYSTTLAALFLAIGAGAIFEVVYEIAKLLRQTSEKEPRPLLDFAGVTLGMLLLYVTGLLIK